MKYNNFCHKYFVKNYINLKMIFIFTQNYAKTPEKSYLLIKVYDRKKLDLDHFIYVIDDIFTNHEISIIMVV